MVAAGTAFGDGDWYFQLAGTGSGWVTWNGGGCASSYDEGTSVTLAASAASGSTFGGWGGACTGTGGCIVTIDGDTTVTATFDRKAEEAPSPAAAEEGAVKASSSAWYKGGKALLKIRCNGAGACKGKLMLKARVKQGKKIKTVVIGKSSFDVAAGKSRTVRVKITNGQVKKLLNSGKTLIVKLSGKGVKNRTIKLKPSKAEHKSHKKHHV